MHSSEIIIFGLHSPCPSISTHHLPIPNGGEEGQSEKEIQCWLFVNGSYLRVVSAGILFTAQFCLVVTRQSLWTLDKENRTLDRCTVRTESKNFVNELLWTLQALTLVKPQSLSHSFHKAQNKMLSDGRCTLRTVLNNTTGWRYQINSIKPWFFNFALIWTIWLKWTKVIAGLVSVLTPSSA